MPRWLSRHTVAMAGLVTVASLMTAVVVAVGASSVSDSGGAGSPEPLLADNAPPPTAVAPPVPEATEDEPQPLPPPAPEPPKTEEPKAPAPKKTEKPPVPEKTQKPTTAPPREPESGETPPWKEPGDPEWPWPGYADFALWLWCWVQPWAGQCEWAGG